MSDPNWQPRSDNKGTAQQIFAGAVLAGLLVLLLSQTCTHRVELPINTNKPAPVPPPQPTTPSIDAGTLWLEFKTDTIAATTKYRGQYVTVTGTVGDVVQRRVFDDVEITYIGLWSVPPGRVWQPGAYYSRMVTCYLGPCNQGKCLKNAKRGTKIALCGKVTGCSLDITGYDGLAVQLDACIPAEE